MQSLLLTVAALAVGIGFSYLSFRRRQKLIDQDYRFPLLGVFVIIFSVGGIISGMNYPWGAVFFWVGLATLSFLHWITYRKVNDAMDRIWRKLTRKPNQTVEPTR